MHQPAEGNLDIKYLTERYNKGVKRVEDFMAVHQRYIQLDSLDSGLPDTIAHMQKNSGANPFLSVTMTMSY